MTAELGLLAIAALFVLANAFFVATEFSLIKLRPTRLKSMIDEGRPGARHVLKMVEHLDSYLSATQFGVTLASLGLGWVGEPAFAKLLVKLSSTLLSDRDQALAVAHTASWVVAFLIITFLHIIVGELGPKSLAIQKAEGTALACAFPMRAFHLVFFPGIYVLNRTATLFLRLFGLSAANQTEDAHSEEELKMILSTSAASGAITAARAAVLERVLELGKKTARQVLVPRNQVRFLDLDEPLDKNIAEARSCGYTWLPVCRGNLDQVEGVVNVKDLFFLLSKGELKSISQVQRPVLFVPEAVPLEQLISEFRRRRRQLAVVVDEHGGTTGIVSLADVAAEVVGDVAELGRRVEEVKVLPGGMLELPGTAPLDDLQDRLDVELDVEDLEVTTIGGYLMAKLGRVPERGDRLSIDEYEISVQEMDGPRVNKVRIEPKRKPASEGLRL